MAEKKARGGGGKARSGQARAQPVVEGGADDFLRGAIITFYSRAADEYVLNRYGIEQPKDPKRTFEGPCHTATGEMCISFVYPDGNCRTNRDTCVKERFFHNGKEI